MRYEIDRWLQSSSLKRSSESRNTPVSTAAENITGASGFTNTGSSKTYENITNASGITNAGSSSENIAGPRAGNANKFRKYSDTYINCGFISIQKGEVLCPQCVICYQVLSNESMKPAKLSRHLQTKHPDCVNKSTNFFEAKADVLHREQKSIHTGTGGNNESAVRASYKVSHH